MLTSSVDLVAAFLIGLGSSAHCMGMCGGIAAGFSNSNKTNRYKSQLLFNLGRLLSYSMLGLIAGLLVSGLSLQMTATQFFIRILAGLMLMAMGLYVSGWWLGLARLEKIAMPLWAAIQPLIKKLQSRNGLNKSLYLGLLWGLLPCGLIYSTLVWASASGSAIEAASLMFFMGLGTLPALITIGLVGGQLVRTPGFRKISGLLLICYGIWTAAVPLQHLLMTGQMQTGEANPHEMHD